VEVNSAVKGRIDFDSHVPLYAQLEALIYAAIRDGAYKSGELIPSEAELVDSYGVSRITVRRALDGLVSEGLLSRFRGKGTVVNAPRFLDDSFRLESFKEKTSRSSSRFSTRVLEVDSIQATVLVAHHMGIEEGDQLIYVKRLRLLEEDPVGLFENYIRASIGVSVEDDFAGSIYGLIEQKCGIGIKTAKRDISSVLADKDTAALMGLERPFPLLSLKTRSCDARGAVIEYSEGFYRTDRYQLVISQDRTQGAR